jgi:hypothetical protein
MVYFKVSEGAKMLTRRAWLGLVAVAAMGFVTVGLAGAAEAPAGGDTGAAAGGARPGRQRGNFDPAQMRQQMNDRMKTAMGATDDEWKVLQPKIEAVQTAQRDARGGGGMGGMMGRGNRGARGGAPAAGDAAAPAAAPAAPATPATPQSEAAKAGDALRKVLDNKEAKPEEIKAALQAFRDARTAGEAKLAAAQKELKEIVTVKQEAYLVMSGMLK